MRLVDLQRTALGVQPQARTWHSDISLEGGVIPPEPEPELHSAVVMCELHATPDSGIIPGAIVTIAMSLVNEGAVAARDLRVAVPLPGAAAFRNGSLVRDGRPLLDDAADELFSTGALIEQMPPKTRATFLWKIGVRIGNKPLVIAPVITAEDTAVIGAEPLIIDRKEGAQNPFASELVRAEPAIAEPQHDRELPIYELDEEEAIEYEAGGAALSPAAEYVPPNEPPIAPAVPPPDQPEPLPPPDQPAPVEEPGEPAIEPDMPSPPEQPPDVEPAAREAVVLAGTIDRPSLSYFERTFNGAKPPTLLNHFILGSALACTRSPEGDDFAELKTHLDAQAQLLQRIVLHEKMGKKEPIGEYAGRAIAQLDRLAPRPVAPVRPPSGPNEITLFTELDAPSLAILSQLQTDRARWDFTKARQMTLALQARDALAPGGADTGRAGIALRAYAQTAAMQLQRFFVRMRLDRTTGLLFSNDETLDAAARTLIAALIELF